MVPRNGKTKALKEGCPLDLERTELPGVPQRFWALAVMWDGKGKNSNIISPAQGFSGVSTCPHTVLTASTPSSDTRGDGNPGQAR